MGAPADSAPPVIAGYLPAQLIAHSYLGSLWVALDQRQGTPGRPVLLRRLELQEHIPPEALQRMACAARDAMALSHENVLSVAAVLQQAESLAVVYEYVEAEPLRSLQSCATQRNLRFPVAVSLRIMIDLARGIKALHGTLAGWPSAPPFGGVAPDSVLVARDGRTRICDALTASCVTLLEGLGLNVAKLAYTAPEQAYATAPLAPAADVFSCGVLLWELLAGTRLLMGSRPTVERKLLEHDWPHLGTQLAGQTIAPALLKLVDRCLSTDPDRRPATPAVLASELEQCGEAVAQLPEVARFIAELAAPRFDQRKLAVRSSLQLPAQAGSTAALSLQLGATRLATPPTILATAQPLATAQLVATPQPPLQPLAAAPPPAPLAPQPSLPGTSRLSGSLRIPLPAQLSGLSPRSAAASATLPSAAAPARVSLPSLRTGVSLPAAPAVLPLSAAPAVLPLSGAPAVLPLSGAPAVLPLPAAPAAVALARIPLVRGGVPRPRLSQPAPRAVSLPAPEPTPTPQPTLEPTPQPTLVAVLPEKSWVEGGSVASGPPATPGAPTAGESEQTPAPAASGAAAPSAAPPVEIFARRVRGKRDAAPHTVPEPWATGAQPAVSPSPLSEGPATERNPELLTATSAPPARSRSTSPPSEWPSFPPGFTPGPQGAPAVAADPDSPLSQEAVVMPEPSALPMGMRTLMGIPLPPPVLLPQLPFASFAPRRSASAPGSSPAVVVIPPESQDSRPPLAPSRPPQPFTSLVPTLAPPPFSEPPRSAPSSGASSRTFSSVPSSGVDAASVDSASEGRISASLRARREGGWSHPPEPRSTRAPRRRSWLARAGATLALGTALVTVLWVRDAGPGPSLAAASATALGAAVLPPLPATQHSPTAPAVLPSRTASEATSNEASGTLRDHQLLELFALEQRTSLSDCSERRPSAAPLPASRARQKSQTQLKAARLELARGNVNAAQLWLCSATALYPGNIAAWRALAELALQRGDGAQAQRTLQRALTRKADDPTLLAALGDAEALLGNLQQSRTLWTRSAPANKPEAQPDQRLAARFDMLGARELSARNFGAALAHYRRAVVLSAGGSAASAGMAKALRGLNQPKAAAPWELRAAELRR